MGVFVSGNANGEGTLYRYKYFNIEKTGKCKWEHGKTTFLLNFFDIFVQLNTQNTLNNNYN